jgi:hypothetical protein
MPTAENARLQYEAGQQATPMSQLTNSGDNTRFTSSAALWSQRAGFAPVVRPNGVLTGLAVSTNASNDTVTVAAGTLNLAGVVTTVNAGTATISRGTGGDVCRITSITINASGAIAAAAGTASTAFSETRGAAGGPPLIAVDAVEIAQVRVGSITAGVVTDGQIFQVVGLHRERADFPLFTIDYRTGGLTFLAALPLIHTGPTTKRVFASFAAPILADVALASDFVPPETSHTVTSTQVYGTTLGSTSSTLNQGTFTAFLEDGVTDGLVTLKNETLWFRFYPDRFKLPHILCQGKLGISRTFPAGDSMQAACTINASAAAAEVA